MYIDTNYSYVKENGYQYLYIDSNYVKENGDQNRIKR